MEEDRISLLPDCLLVEIISRLPSTKQAIKTSTLSKRWKHLWTEVSNLVFLDDKLDGHCNYSITDYVSVVGKTLTQHRQLSLNKFQLHIPYYSSSQTERSKINDWIQHAVNCNVQELDIALRIGSYYMYECKLVFDHSFFVNSCFTHLKLKDCSILLNPSGTISWTNLRTLCISYNELDEGFIQNVLSGFLLLETLKLEFCYGFSRIDVTSKSFKNLAIVGYLDFGDSESRPIIKSDAPYILSLKLQRYVSCNRIVIDGCLEIKDSESRPIIGLGYGIEDYTIHREEEIVNKLIQNLSHAKEVTIKTSCLLTLFGLKANGVSFP